VHCRRTADWCSHCSTELYRQRCGIEGRALRCIRCVAGPGIGYHARCTLVLVLAPLEDSRSIARRANVSNLTGSSSPPRGAAAARLRHRSLMSTCVPDRRRSQLSACCSQRAQSWWRWVREARSVDVSTSAWFAGGCGWCRHTAGGTDSVGVAHAGESHECSAQRRHARAGGRQVRWVATVCVAGVAALTGPLRRPSSADHHLRLHEATLYQTGSALQGWGFAICC
jgi:hypothetical protein